MRLGFRTRIELPSCITKDFKYLVVDATPPGMNDFINPIVDPSFLTGTLLAGDQQQREQESKDQHNQERNEKRQQKRKEVISGLNTLIGQLTGLLEYYNTEEREKQEEDIDRFVKKNHLALISTPWYQPTLWSDTLLADPLLAGNQQQREQQRGS